MYYAASLMHHLRLYYREAALVFFGSRIAYRIIKDDKVNNAVVDVGFETVIDGFKSH